ncbi:MAG TPA: histone deacetylase [Candidatus Bathyarchaeota archaeon]|nr:histone deacetylase [Candidatus Bathyarchaeota archaeon]
MKQTTKTVLVYSPKYLLHKTGPDHPEVPSRLRVIKRELKKSGILENKNCLLVEPEPASIDDLKLVHDVGYIHAIKQVCSNGGGMLDKEDTVVCSESYEIARLAVGGVLKAVALVMNKKCNNGFAFVRPPGHHAGSNYPMGFCVFNNVAIAAAHLLNNYNLERVLILDIDVHHGNGTQEIFYNNKKVLYISIHEDPVEFPLTGFADELGQGKGQGYSVNVPLPYGSDDKIYVTAFNDVVAPIINQYQPQFILISAGFDSHYKDPIGNLYVSSRSYGKIFDFVLEAASKFCQGKVVAVLEGGYSLQFLGKLACAATAKMAGVEYVVKDKPYCAEPIVQKKAKFMLKQIKTVQSRFWNLK